MKVIGLCGGSGSGKGVVCSCFSKFGVPSIDTDAVYREMTDGDSQCLRALACAFGNSIISCDGSLNRKMLASIVFSGEGAEERRRTLNQIAHKFILEEARRRILKYKSEGYDICIIDAPVLFESGFDKECDRTVCVVADKSLRVKRIMMRDGLSESDALMRINSQKSDDELRHLCDFVIENNGDYEALLDEVLRVKKLITEN